MYNRCKELKEYSNTRNASITFLRTLLMILSISIPLSILWIFSKPILSMYHDNISYYGGLYTRWMILSLPFYLFGEAIKSFLISNDIKLTWIIFGGNLLSLLLSYLFIFPFKLGFKGSPLSFFLVCLLRIISFIIIGRLNGFNLISLLFNNNISFNDLININEFKYHIIDGFKDGFLFSFEQFGYDIPLLISGYLDTTSFIAFSILFISIKIINTIPSFIYMNIIQIIDRKLKQLKVEESIFLIRVSIIIALSLIMIISIPLVSLKSVWGYIFVSYSDVIKLTGKALPIIIPIIITDSFFLLIRDFIPKKYLIYGLSLIRLYIITSVLTSIFCFRWGAGLGIPGIGLGIIISNLILDITVFILFRKYGYGKVLFEDKVGYEYERNVLIELDEMYW